MVSSQYQPLFKAIALLLVTLGFSWFLHSYYDPTALAKANAMSATDYLSHQRHLHQHSFFFWFTTLFLVGGAYLGINEFIVYILSLITQRKTNR